VTAPPPPPAIASLATNPMSKSNSVQTLTVNGNGFQNGKGLQLLLSTRGGPALLLPGTFVSSSKFTVAVNVGNVARTWSVEAINPDGQTSNTATLTVH